ncbi:unnamed protein product, partial [Prorocentrum cordatum]
QGHAAVLRRPEPERVLAGRRGPRVAPARRAGRRGGGGAAGGAAPGLLGVAPRAAAAAHPLRPRRAGAGSTRGPPGVRRSVVLGRPGRRWLGLRRRRRWRGLQRRGRRGPGEPARGLPRLRQAAAAARA